MRDGMHGDEILDFHCSKRNRVDGIGAVHILNNRDLLIRFWNWQCIDGVMRRVFTREIQRPVVDNADLESIKLWHAKRNLLEVAEMLAH